MDLFRLISIVIIGMISIIGAISNSCKQRYFGSGSSFVCVCNADYCDDIPTIDANSTVGQAILITSTKSEARFQKSYLSFGSVYQGDAITHEVTVDSSKRYQTILGFGGAFTDATGINIASLSSATQDRLLRSYYGPDGLDYGVGRVPIGGADFSTRPYTYDDSPTADPTLSNFNLAPEDFTYKIPLIQKAKSLSSKTIKLFASPWSAPAWMKTNGNLKGRGYLLRKYYQTWANYFVRFFDDYAKSNVTFWGLTPQNEPSTGNIPGWTFNCMGWIPQTQINFIGNYLGPTLESNGYGHLKMMIFDDSRLFFPIWPLRILRDEKASKYVSGVAVHYYWDFVIPASVLTTMHNLFPDRFLFASEASEGDWSVRSRKVILGSWERLEKYATDIIKDLNNWVTGWTDWNLALNEEGGPNWANYNLDATILVNAEKDEFYRQPTFYSIGHFSKYIPEDSVRIYYEIKASKRSWLNWWIPELNPLMVTAFLRPDGLQRTIVLLNRSEQNRVILLRDKDRPGSYLKVDCPPRSLQTLIYV